MDQRERSEFVLLWVLATCDTFILYNLFNLSFLESLVIGFLLVCMFIGLGAYNGLSGQYCCKADDSEESINKYGFLKLRVIW